jgi:hypothetical protein
MGNRLKHKTFSAVIANRQVPGSSPGLGSSISAKPLRQNRLLRLHGPNRMVETWERQSPDWRLATRPPRRGDWRSRGPD